MRMITDTNTIMNEFKAGNLDMAGFTGEQTQQLKKEELKCYNMMTVVTSI